MGGTLVRLYIILALMGGTVMEGFAPRYSIGLMGMVAERRGLSVEGCLISSAYYPIGTHLYVYGRNTQVLRYCTTVDVSHPKDVNRHRRTKRIIEIAGEDALMLCGNMGKPTDCPVVVFYIGQ